MGGSNQSKFFSVIWTMSTAFKFPSSSTTDEDDDEFNLQLDGLELYEEEEIFSIASPTIKEIAEDDDASFAKKLLLSPRWHDKNAPIREFKELSTNEYYSKSREILNPISYSTNIHIH